LRELWRSVGATQVHGEDGGPEAGSISVCLNCGQLAIFNADLTLRRMTREEVADAMKDRNAWQIISRAQRIIEQRGKFA
jgi:hypothetical protein